MDFGLKPSITFEVWNDHMKKVERQFMNSMVLRGVPDVLLLVTYVENFQGSWQGSPLIDSELDETTGPRSKRRPYDNYTHFLLCNRETHEVSYVCFKGSRSILPDNFPGIAFLKWRDLKDMFELFNSNLAKDNFVVEGLNNDRDIWEPRYEFKRVPKEFIERCSAYGLMTVMCHSNPIGWVEVPSTEPQYITDNNGRRRYTEIGDSTVREWHVEQRFIVRDIKGRYGFTMKTGKQSADLPPSMHSSIQWADDLRALLVWFDMQFESDPLFQEKHAKVTDFMKMLEQFMQTA